MEPTIATKLLRIELDRNALHSWKIRLSNLGNGHEYGKIDKDTKTFWLDEAFTIKSTEDELKYEIRERVAMIALKEQSEVSTSRITRLVEKCPECGKVAKEKTHFINKNKKFVILECNHTIITDALSTSPFESIVFDGDPSCKHVWGKGIYYTFCAHCTARRLYPFQVEGARAIEEANGRFAILDDQGLGKTIQALAYLKFHKHDAWPFLWITGTGTVYQHAKEIVRVLGYEAVPQIIQGGKSIVIPTLNAVASYDSFRRLSAQDFSTFKCVISDEVQKIKNPDSLRTKALRKAIVNINKVIPTSATFWKNRGSEAYTMLNILSPSRFNNYESFKRNEVTEYWDGNKMKEGGLRPGFIKEIRDIAIRRERITVMPELPLINRTRIIVEMPEHAKAVLREEEAKLVKEFNTHLLEGTDDSFAANAAVMQSLIVMRQVVGIAKVPRTVEYVKEFLEETDRKIVVFVHHIKCGELILHQLQEYCEKEELPKVLSLTASMSPYDRGKTAEAFNSPAHRVLIASTLASGEGLNLQTCADCVMHERQWNPANEEQAEGRFIRIGQTAQSVNAVYMHGDGTVDADLHGIVEPKRIQFHNSMNGTEMAQWNQANVIADLVKAIAARHKKGKK